MIMSTLFLSSKHTRLSKNQQSVYRSRDGAAGADWSRVGRCPTRPEPGRSMGVQPRLEALS